jgi:hypothetical protein
MESASIEDILGDIEFEQDENAFDGINSVALEDGDITVQSEGYYVENFMTRTIFDEKARVKFIKAVVKLVRSAPEYTQYLAYLKDNFGLTSCSFLPNVHDELASIELHHYPFSLFDVCDTVFEDLIKQDIKVTTFDIADKVLALHHKNQIGLVPLSETMHQLVHAGKLFVNFKQVYGNVMDFINDYEEAFSPELIDNFKVLYKKSLEENKFCIDGFFNLLELEVSEPIPSDDLDSLNVIRPQE